MDQRSASNRPERTAPQWRAESLPNRPAYAGPFAGMPARVIHDRWWPRISLFRPSTCDLSWPLCPRTKCKNDGISRHFKKEADEGGREGYIYTKIVSLRYPTQPPFNICEIGRVVSKWSMTIMATTVSGTARNIPGKPHNRPHKASDARITSGLSADRVADDHGFHDRSRGDVDEQQQDRGRDAAPIGCRRRGTRSRPASCRRSRCRCTG